MVVEWASESLLLLVELSECHVLVEWHLRVTCDTWPHYIILLLLERRPRRSCSVLVCESACEDLCAEETEGVDEEEEEEEVEEGEVCVGSCAGWRDWWVRDSNSSRSSAALRLESGSHEL